ncbi:MAG: glycosyltransferase family 39 protein [bacterium]
MKKTHWLFLILLIGFLLRFFYIYFFVGFSAPPESHGYWLEKAGYNLSQGGGFGIQPDMPTAKKPPLYPAFLAFIYFFFGQNFALVKLGHILLALLTCLFTFLTAKDISQNISGNNDFSLFPIFSALILAVIPTYIYISGLFLTENLCILFSLLAIFFLLKTEKTPSFINQFSTGLFLGLTNLTRPNFISFLFILPIWAFLRFPGKEASKIFLTITLTTLIVIAPWMIRNWNIYHGFIPIATGGGRIFLAGNNPEAIGDAILVSGSPRLYFSEGIPQGEEKRDWTKWEGDSWQNMYLSDLDSENFSSGLDEKEADRKYYLQGLNWIKGNPLGFLKLLPQKAYRFWQYWSPHTRWPPLSGNLKIIDLFFYIPFLLLVALGIIFSFKQITLRTSFFSLYLILIYSQIITLISFGDARQRFLFLPFLSIFAGWELNNLYLSLAKFKKRSSFLSKEH